MRDRRWVYAGLALAAGVGVARLLATRGPKIVPGQTRLFLLGDSLAVGLTPPLSALARDQRVSFDALAMVGTRIDQWAQSQKLVERLESFRPTLILVSLGTNDEYMQGNVVAMQKPHFETLMRRLESTGAEVVWLGPPPQPKAPSPEVVAMIRDEIPSSRYFPSETIEIQRGPDAPVHHPTVRGYAAWAGAIWSWLS